MKSLKTTFCIIVFSLGIFIPGYAQFQTLDIYQGSKHNRISGIDSSGNAAKKIIIKDSNRNVAIERPLIVAPLKQIKVTSPYGKRMHPLTQKVTMHNGIDLRAHYEPVYSMLPGVIKRVGEDNKSGKFIIVSTGDFQLSYCHLSRIKVQKGDVVKAGEQIGISGQTGKVSGPHLHLVIKLAGITYDPIILLNIQKNNTVNSRSQK